MPDTGLSQPNNHALLPSLKGPEALKALSTEQLEQLAAEMRSAIIDQVSQTGGHLAPNLGVVELTLALHRVFDFSHDRLLFDVGHQCYPHKLLTGRYPLLSQLRTRQGMAGFPDPSESPFDLFSVGHAGTAISTSVGMARGDDVIAGGTGASGRRVVSIVGDASIVNGVALEGLNNAGTLNRQCLIVLNDNGMSISRPQGAMSYYLDKLRVSHRFDKFKKAARDVTDQLGVTKTVEDLYHRGSEAMIKALTAGQGHMFDNFGLICIGPIDGHDLPTLLDVLDDVQDVDKPVLLHVKTTKGKGLEAAETDPTSLHSPKPFTMTGCRVEMQPSGRSFTQAFGDALCEVMAQDDKIFAVTAAMADGTGVTQAMEKYPERTLDTGICESHAMDMCAGMAKSGVKPFFAVYSTFAQRALDQVFQEVCLQGLPVRVCMDRAGFVGGDGAVHHGFMDIAMFRVFPNAVLLAPSDEPNLKAAMQFMANYEDGATFLRYPRDVVAPEPTQADVPPFVLGKANPVRLHDTPSAAILAYGSMLYTALQAADELAAQGQPINVYDARFAKPVDIELITKLCNQGIPIITLEDHALTGGFGSAVLETANDAGLNSQHIHRMGMPMQWSAQDSRSNQLAEAGLSVEQITAKLLEIAKPDPAITTKASAAKA